MNKETFFVYEVLGQSKIERVEMSDDKNHYGYEPQAMLELKEPGRFALDHLFAKLKGKAALHPFKKGDLVAVRLDFWSYRKDGNYVNDIVIDDIKLVKDLDYQYL